jgi:tetratricopeptide (TPR) repeat protein
MASDYFRNATNADPRFANAYGYLAATYFWADPPWNNLWVFLPQARTVALQALDLDDTLPEPHLALGVYYGLHEWNWNRALKEDQRAVELDGSSFCHLCYAELLRVMGRTNQALQEIYQARKLDPNSRIINVRLIHYLTCARQYSNALTQIDKVEAMQAAGNMWWDRKELFLALGQIDNALEAERRARIADGDSITNVERNIDELRSAVAVEGMKAIWRPELEYSKQHSYILDQACCHAQLGNTNEALGLLDKILEQHNTDLNGLTFGIMTDWRLDPLRSHPRFHEILRKMHFE